MIEKLHITEIHGFQLFSHPLIIIDLCEQKGPQVVMLWCFVYPEAYQCVDRPNKILFTKTNIDNGVSSVNSQYKYLGADECDL